MWVSYDISGIVACARRCYSRSHIPAQFMKIGTFPKRTWGECKECGNTGMLNYMNHCLVCKTREQKRRQREEKWQKVESGEML